MSNAISMSYYRKLPYDLTRDLHGVSLFSTQPNALIAGLNLPAKSMQEMIAVAKAKPAQLTYASAGNGSTQHLMANCSSRWRRSTSLMCRTRAPVPPSTI